MSAVREIGLRRVRAEVIRSPLGGVVLAVADPASDPLPPLTNKEIAIFHLFTPDALTNPVKLTIIEAVVRKIRPKGGLIVVAFNPKSDRYEYWDRPVFEPLGSEWPAGEPALYGTIRTAQAACRRAGLSAAGKGLHAPEVALWVHPDAYVLPLEKYVRTAQGFLLPA